MKRKAEADKIQDTARPVKIVEADCNDLLLRDLVAHLSQNRDPLRKEWARRIAEAQFLTAMSEEEIFFEAATVFDNYVEVLETGRVEALQAYARNLSERIIPRGVETHEVVGIVLLLRDVMARSLFKKYQADFDLLNHVLDAYEPAANRIANTVAVSFVRERDRNRDPEHLRGDDGGEPGAQVSAPPLGLAALDAGGEDIHRIEVDRNFHRHQVGSAVFALGASNRQLAREIGARKRAQEALRETRDHYFELFQQASAMQEDLRELSGKVLSAQEEERKRISRELHDEIGQALTAVNVSIAMLKRQAGGDQDFQRKVTEAQELLVQSMETVHRFARELRPAAFDHLGAQVAFSSYLKSFSERTGIKTDLRSKLDLNRIDGQHGIVLFRVVQESLANVFKHARASRVVLAFELAGEKLRMEIRDNGRAFRIREQTRAKWKGRLGLLGMQERVRLINGEFSVDSVPGRGTTVRVEVGCNPRSLLLSKAGESHRLRKAS